MSYLLYVQATCLAVACVIALPAWLVPYLAMKAEVKQKIEKALATSFVAVLSVSLPAFLTMIALKLAGTGQ